MWANKKKMPKKMADILKKNTYRGMSSHIQIITTTFSFLSIGPTMSLWLLSKIMNKRILK